MDYTTNFNLKKPALTDFALITDIDDDMDIIDAQLKAVKDTADGAAADVAGKQDRITGAASVITSDNLDPGKALVSSPTTGKVIVSSVTATELGRLSGVTGNVQTQIDAKQAAITGAATTVTGSDLTANRALASNGSGKIAASSVTTTELGRLSGVTAPIQTQIDGKQATITGAATTITGSDLTASSALVSNASGKVAASSTTATELGYVHGVTSNIQTQLNSKQGTIGGAASTITDSNLDPGLALVSSPTTGKVIVSSTTATEISRLSGVTSNVQTQLNGKAPNDHASSATTYGVGTSSNYGHLRIADNLNTPSFDSNAPVALSAYRGKVLYDMVAAKAAVITGGNDSVNATVSSGNTQNLLYGSAVDTSYFSMTTGGVFTFKTAGTYLMFIRMQMGSPTAGGVARLDVEARYRNAGTTTWGTKQNIGSNWVTGTFGTVVQLNVLTAPSDGYQMFLDVLAVDGSAKINAFSVTVIKLT